MSLVATCVDWLILTFNVSFVFQCSHGENWCFRLRCDSVIAARLYFILIYNSSPIRGSEKPPRIGAPPSHNQITNSAFSFLCQKGSRGRMHTSWFEPSLSKEGRGDSCIEGFLHVVSWADSAAPAPSLLPSLIPIRIRPSVLLLSVSPSALLSAISVDSDNVSRQQGRRH